VNPAQIICAGSILFGPSIGAFTFGLCFGFGFTFGLCLCFGLSDDHMAALICFQDGGFCHAIIADGERWSCSHRHHQGRRVQEAFRETLQKFTPSVMNPGHFSSFFVHGNVISINLRDNASTTSHAVFF